MELENGQNTELNTKTRGLMPPWPKGVSGNPGGRPKRKPITESYDRALSKETCDQIAKSVIRQAKKGNIRAVIELTDRVEGKLGNDDSDSGKPKIQVIVMNGISRPNGPDATT